MKQIVLKTLGVLVLTFSFNLTVHALTVLSYESSSTSFLRGESRTIFGDDKDHEFRAGASRIDATIFVNNYPLFDEGNVPFESWSVRFSLPFSETLKLGLYPDAVYSRDFGGDAPQLRFIRRTVSSYNYNGVFDILELNDSEGTGVNSFAADFALYNVIDKTKWLRGQVRYNSNIGLDGKPIDGPGKTTDVPEPPMLLLLGAAFIGMVGRKIQAEK